MLRKLVQASDEIATSAFNPQGRPVAQILDDAEGKIFRIGEEGSRAGQGFQSMDQLVVAADRPRQRAARERRRGSHRRAHRLLRSRPHDRRAAGGRPDRARGAPVDGQDRARAQHRRARRACNEGLPVVVFSMEMGASQLALRMVGSLGRIDQQHLRTGALRDDEWGRLSEAVEKLAQGEHSFIDESGSLSPSELRARARRQARQCGAARPDRRRLPAADERQRRDERREPRHRPSARSRAR